MKLLHKVSLVIIILAIVVAATFALIIYSLTLSSLKEAISIQQIEIARQAMDKIDRLLYERINNIIAISGDEGYESLLVRSHDSNFKDQIVSSTNKLQKLSLVTGPWDSLSLVNTNGEIVVSASENQIGQNIKDKIYKDSNFESVFKGDLYYSDLFLDSKTGNPSMVFASPIRYGKDPKQPIVGAAVGNLSWPVILEILQDIHGSNAELFNKDGIEIGNNHSEYMSEILKDDASNNPVVKKALSGISGAEVLKGIDKQKKEDQLISYVPQKGFLINKGNGWALLIEVPVSKVFADAIRNAYNLVLIIIPIVIFAALIVLLMLQRVFINPVIKLTKITKNIAQGDFSKKAEVTSRDEISELAASFNQMTKDLNQMIEKTKEDQVKLSASISSLTLGFIMTDDKNNVVTINQAARNILCTSAKSPLATVEKCDLTHIEDELKGAIDLRALINRSILEKKALLIRELEFQNRFLKIFITPIMENIRAIGSVVLVDDISEAKIVDRSRDEFFSIASHELRTPLTAIKGNTSMIKEFYADKIKDPELKEMISDIHESSVRLIQIVNDFLDTSRLEQGRMEFKKNAIDVSELIASVISEYQVTGSRKKIALVYHKDEKGQAIPQIFADKDKSKQVLINLIGNALKCTKRGSIIITTKVLKGFVKILVTDTGRGISKENQNLLFHKFQQANTSLLTRDATKGTGLGLYISKLIIQGMGGEIKLEESAEEKGSTFSFTLPIATKEQIVSLKPEAIEVKIDTATGLAKS